MEHTVLTLHTIKHFNGYFIDNQTGTLFDTLNYSLFKYGAGTVARQYGYALAARFIKEFPDWIVGEDNRLYVSSSPSKIVPTAAAGIARYFTEAINRYLSSKNLPLATHFKLDRYTVFEGDYGTLSTEDRQDIMSRNHFAVPSGIDLSGKNIVVIDDVRITGCHEETIINTLKQCNLRKMCSAYVATLQQGEGTKTPQLESVLNHTVIRSLEDLHHLIQLMSGLYIVNARVCKFLLSQQDLNALESFLTQQEHRFIRLLHHYCVGDGYHEMQTYKKQFDVIKRVFDDIPDESEEQTDEEEPAFSLPELDLDFFWIH